MSSALTVEINGSLNSKVLDSSVAITDIINERSTCNFSIVSTLLTEAVIGYEVIIRDTSNSNIKIFGGFIKRIQKRLIKGSNGSIFYNIECVDYNSIADRRLVNKIYTEELIEDILNDIIDEYLTVEGVSLGDYPSGITIVKATFAQKSISQTLDFIRNEIGYNWNIDFDKKLNLFLREEYEGDPLDVAVCEVFDIEETTEQYRNKQYIKGGQDETELISNEVVTPKPDGESKTFVTRFPIAKKPQIFIDSVEVNADDIGINGLDTGKEWYWNKGVARIVQSDSETTLTDTKTLDVTYQGLVKIIVVADKIDEITARQNIEGGSGIYEKVEDKASIDKREAATSYANGLLNRYADISQRVTIRTRQFRQAGQIIRLTNTYLNVNSDFLIESVDVADEKGLTYYNIKLFSQESFGSWVEFFKNLTKSSTDFIIAEDEVLVFLNTERNRYDWTGELEIKVFGALYPSDARFPSNTLYPGTLQQTVTLND